VRFFVAYDIPGGPVYSVDEIPGDAHFRARDLLVEQEHPVAGRVTLVGTPIKVAGEAFETAPAPAAGAHTDDVLASVLGIPATEIAALRRDGIT
jgi:crotonobetainyl-CoA:carnitine CoA-transferase CaiB-like acyl-CoA transferase